MTRIIIGLDFGTTFSGIAWALEASPEDVEVISNWPRTGNRTSPKVPTIISYQNERLLWGFQAASSDKAIKGFKLLLDKSQEKRYHPAVRSKELISEYGKNAEYVTADYLQHLIVFAKQVFRRRFQNALDFMELQYVLTVPAVWSDKAKDSTRAAALKAGIPVSQLSLVSEPEAAAMYCLKTLQPESIHEDDVVVVCDAGGGTVDLISYRISSLSPLLLKEETQGTGGLCGSMYLDARFEALLEERLGKQYASLPGTCLETARKYWREDLKPSFGTLLGEDDDDDDDSTIIPDRVPLPGAKDNVSSDLQEGFLYLEGDDIKEIFDPVVDEVEDLIRGQIQDVSKNGKTAKAILLVGGFGASEYLFRRLKKAFPGTLLMQPPNAWTAVARGAIHHGLGDNPVDERIARRHYGISHTEKFDPSCHDETTKYWDPMDEVYRVSDQMSWYIRKGSRIFEKKPISFPFSRTFWKRDPLEKYKCPVRLYVCHHNEAPLKCSAPGVFLNCQLSVDFSDIPTTLFELKRNSKGQEYYKVEFDVNMTPRSATILFEVVFNGVSYGSVQAKY